MADRVVMPKLGLTMVRGKITKWLKREGDEVRPGEPLFEVMTDKVTMVVESEVSGVLRRIVVGKGTSVPVGTTVAVVAGADEDIEGLLEAPRDEEAEAGPERAEAEPGPDASERPAAPAREPAAERGRGQRVAASPAARRVARKMGVDLERLGSGSGPRGMLTVADVRRARGRATPLARAVAAEAGVDVSELTGTGPGGKVRASDVRRAAAPQRRDRTVPLEGRRQVIAERMLASARETASVSLYAYADMTRAAALKRVANAREGVPHVTYTDLIVIAVARALRDFPAVNSSLVGEEIVSHGRINVGVAVDVPEGLVVPVVRDADAKGLAAIAAERQRLVEAARRDELRPDDLEGGTFTVTNLGAYGIESFSPIINLPQAAILAVGEVADRPVARDGAVEIRPQACLTLVFDHRVVDGGPAARFLGRVRELIEEPDLLLL